MMRRGQNALLQSVALGHVIYIFRFIIKQHPVYGKKQHSQTAFNGHYS